MEKTNKKIKYRTDEQQEMIKFLIILVIVIVCVVGIYFFTRAFVTKDLKKEEETKEVTPGSINYNNTLVGSMLNRPYDAYYVLVYDMKSVSAGKYEAIYNKYSNAANDVEKELANKDKNKIKIYCVDLSNKLNESYKATDKSNPDAKTIDELQFGEITLVKVEKGNITKYIENKEEIEKELEI